MRLQDRAAVQAALLLPLLGAILLAQQPQARIRIDTSRAIGEVHPHIFGNFAEHLGRCIYGGIFEEGSPLSDSEGFRKDVLDAVKPLGVSVLRWPGGNFASGYNWMDGIGPRDQRPACAEHARTTPGARWNPIASAPTSFCAIANASAPSPTSASTPGWAASTAPGSGWSTATKRAPPTGPTSAARTAAKSPGT